MKPEYIVILALIFVIWRLATRAVGIVPPPPDNEPDAQTPPDAEHTAIVTDIGEFIERAHAS